VSTIVQDDGKISIPLEVREALGLGPETALDYNGALSPRGD
jgi:bifunctional DNA-binding transcriptional regulator/antitoxin component of YhaV-PrlF toxin-antitoxin module